MELETFAEDNADMSKETLHIATFGNEDKDAITTAIRYLPISKLIIITLDTLTEEASIFSGQIGRTLGIPTEVHGIQQPILFNTIKLIRSILQKNASRYDDVIVNVTSGDKQLGCAALTAAFINRLKTIVVNEGKPMLLPIIKMSYNEIISDAKLRILKALEEVGGFVKDLSELSRLTGFGKPLLSYHINGSEGTKGLVSLGLVKVSKSRKERNKVAITELGRMLLLGMS